MKQEQLTEKFDVRKLAGQTAYWDGRGTILIRRHNPSKGSMDGLDRLLMKMKEDCPQWQILEGMVVDVHENDALTVHFAATNVYVQPGGYVLVY